MTFFDLEKYSCILYILKNVLNPICHYEVYMLSEFLCVLKNVREIENIKLLVVLK